MSQAATLRDLDAIFAEQLLAAGMADTATYTPPGAGDPVDCTVLVDRNAQFFGDNGEVFGHRILITIFLAEIAAPARQGVIAIGAESFALEQLDARDESQQRWLVVPA
jgi:hypothetical protein